VKLLLYTEQFPDAPGSGSRTVRHSGIGRYCSDLATGLAAAGHAVTVLAPQSGGPSGSTPFSVLALPRSLGTVVGRAARVRRALHGGAGHLLVTGDPVAHRVLAFGGAPRGVPLVPLFYGTELRALQPALGYGGFAPVALLRRAAWRRYLDKARHRVCISRYTARQLDEAMGRAVASLVVYPAVADELLATAPPPPRAEPPPGPLRLLVIGRISERKNQLGVLRMLAALRGAGAPALHCTLLGNVDAPRHEPYFRSVRDFIAAAGLGDMVAILAHADAAAKRTALDACDVVVALSRTVGASVEGFGITALEAAARARPAIVSGEGGMPETVADGVTGLVVGVDDERAFGRALAALASDAAWRRELGEAALARVRRDFTTAAMARRFAEGIA
jgi:glycosyltransferase involved in cell wall biosynthesis